VGRGCKFSRHGTLQWRRSEHIQFEQGQFQRQPPALVENLQHWWRLGQDPDDLGKDSGIASNLIDVDFNSLNITAADIDAESPA